MSKWESKKLGDIGEGYIGLTYTPDDVSDKGTIVLRSGNIQDNKLDFSDVVRVKKKINEKLRVKNEDILICSRNGSSNLVGKSALIPNLDEEMTFGAFMMIYKSEYNRFLIHFLHSIHFRRQLGKSATTTINQITKKMLDEIEVPFPPIQIQKQIAKTLDTVAELLAMRKQQLAELDEFLKSIFLEMFGDPVLNDKRWATQPMRSVGKFVSGGTPSKERNDYWTGNFPWVSPKDMKVPYISNSQNFISNKVFEETSLKKIAPGHLLIVVRGMILAHSFPTAVNTVEVSINQDMKAILPIEDFNVIYLKHCLDNMKHQILKIITTAGHGTKKFDADSIEKVFIPVPPRTLQNKFTSIVTKIEEQKSLVKKAIEETQYLFDSLMNEYFE